MMSRRGAYLLVAVTVVTSIVAPAIAIVVLPAAVLFALLELWDAKRRIDELAEDLTEEAQKREWEERP